jgi:hypothetical protein
MRLTGLRQQILVDDRTCAVCELPVTGVARAPVRRKVESTGTLVTTAVWCRLQPCGHTFMVRSGGLIR